MGAILNRQHFDGIQENDEWSAFRRNVSQERFEMVHKWKQFRWNAVGWEVVEHGNLVTKARQQRDNTRTFWRRAKKSDNSQSRDAIFTIDVQPPSDLWTENTKIFRNLIRNSLKGSWHWI